jgi:disulfide bond formation protein DsbB
MDYLFSTLPFLEVLILAFTGDGNCAEVLWTFIGISIPGWVLIALSILMVYCLMVLKNANEIHSHK